MLSESALMLSTCESALMLSTCAFLPPQAVISNVLSIIREINNVVFFMSVTFGL
jgi:hypothetical protein